MKKIVSSVLVCVLLLATVFTLASCETKLNGEYKSDYGVIFEFEGDEVTVSYNVFAVKGTYAIDGDVITFDFKESISFIDISGDCEYSDGTKDGKHYIKIDGTEYYKQ